MATHRMETVEQATVQKKLTKNMVSISAKKFYANMFI